MLGPPPGSDIEAKFWPGSVCAMRPKPTKGMLHHAYEMNGGDQLNGSLA